MTNSVAIRRLPTGVPGFDEVLGGGLPELSFNLIAGAGIPSPDGGHREDQPQRHGDTENPTPSVESSNRTPASILIGTTTRSSVCVLSE